MIVRRVIPSSSAAFVRFPSHRCSASIIDRFSILFRDEGLAGTTRCSSLISMSEASMNGGVAKIKALSMIFSSSRTFPGNEIETIVLTLDKSLRILEVLEKNVALAQKTYDLTEQEYNAGIVELLEVEEVNDDLQEAKLNIIEESYNYLSGLFDLEYALNTTWSSF